MGGKRGKKGKKDRPARRLEIGKKKKHIALTEFPGTFQNVANRLHEKHCFEVGPARRVTLLAEPTFCFHVNGSPRSFCKEKVSLLRVACVASISQASPGS